MHITRSLVERARGPSPWDLGNQVLYDLCREHPEHRYAPAVLAKVWLIGRSYAAAIERRREKTNLNDDFYIEKVAPTITRSGIDSWIRAAASLKSLSWSSIGTVLSTHSKVTQLFSKISGLEKRSLASKYLHFHLPDLFYIYDTRAVEAMRKLSSVTGRATECQGIGDNEYRKLLVKCLRLQEFVNERFHVALTPREIDNLLLMVHAEKT